MKNNNKVEITGVLQRVKAFEKVAKFNLNVKTEKGRDNYLSCTAFGDHIASIRDYCEEGDIITVHGRLEKSSYKNKEGLAAWETSVIVSKIERRLDLMNDVGSFEPKGEPINQTNWDDDDVPF